MLTRAMTGRFVIIFSTTTIFGPIAALVCFKVIHNMFRIGIQNVFIIKYFGALAGRPTGSVAYDVAQASNTLKLISMFCIKSVIPPPQHLNDRFFHPIGCLLTPTRRR